MMSLLEEEALMAFQLIVVRKEEWILAHPSLPLVCVQSSPVPLTFERGDEILYDSYRDFLDAKLGKSPCCDACIGLAQ